MIDREITRIETGRLCLRPLISNDIPAIQKGAATFEVAEWLAALPHPYPEDGASEFFAYSKTAWADGTEYVLGIEHKETGAYLGNLGVMHKEEGFWEIGYWLAHPHWGSGYATEAIKAALGWAFETFEMDQILARHRVENDRSSRVLIKCGFSYTGKSETVFADVINREIENLWMELRRDD